jgi:hypothetical protein
MDLWLKLGIKKSRNDKFIFQQIIYYIFQIVGYFSFSRFINFAMHLDIHYILHDKKTTVSTWKSQNDL